MKRDSGLVAAPEVQSRLHWSPAQKEAGTLALSIPGVGCHASDLADHLCCRGHLQLRGDCGPPTRPPEGHGHCRPGNIIPIPSISQRGPRIRAASQVPTSHGNLDPVKAPGCCVALNGALTFLGLNLSFAILEGWLLTSAQISWAVRLSTHVCMPIYTDTPTGVCQPVSPAYLSKSSLPPAMAEVSSQRPKGQSGPDPKPAVLRDSRSLEGHAKIFDSVPKGPRSPGLWLGGGRRLIRQCLFSH